MTTAIPGGRQPADAAALPSPEQALANACRLLRQAELETDRQLMERFERLGDSWIHVSHVLLAMRQEP